MMKSNSKKFLTLILTIVAISCLATQVFADNAIVIGGNTDTNIAANTATTTNTANTQTILPTTNATTINAVKSTSTYNTTNNTTSTLPKTGETDIYIVTALIVVCGIFAIYAYKKIRDYKNM